jgi:hypothetical protein
VNAALAKRRPDRFQITCGVGSLHSSLALRRCDEFRRLLIGGAGRIANPIAEGKTRSKRSDKHVARPMGALDLDGNAQKGNLVTLLGRN